MLDAERVTAVRSLGGAEADKLGAMTPLSSQIRRVTALDDAQVDALADLLIDCVDGGASVGFMQPLSRERAVAFWRLVERGVSAGERVLFVADDSLGTCGSVQLILAQPENQPHRADLSKLLVHRRARRQGLGAELMRAAEAAALDCGRTLLVLDTATGEAERLYERLGWTRVGTIPNYALLPEGSWCATTIYYRDLSADERDRAGYPTRGVPWRGDEAPQ